jgi:hypothetical protein
VTGCDDPLDAGLADTPGGLDEALADDEPLVEVLVAAALLAGAAAITATKPVNAAAATPVATHRARAAT